MEEKEVLSYLTVSSQWNFFLGPTTLFPGFSSSSSSDPFFSRSSSACNLQLEQFSLELYDTDKIFHWKRSVILGVKGKNNPQRTCFQIFAILPYKINSLISLSPLLYSSQTNEKDTLYRCFHWCPYKLQAVPLLGSSRIFIKLLIPLQV